MHVATSRINEQRSGSSYGNEMRVCNRRGKGFDVRGTALAVHGAVFNCGECFGSGG